MQLEAREASETREHLLNTAVRLMRENDTIDVSLSELSRESGLNSALVKYYFGNKEGMLRELLAREMEDVAKGIAQLRTQDLDPEARMRLHVSRVVDRFYDVPFILLLLMRLMQDSTPAEAQRMADNHLRPVYDLYEEMIAEGTAKGLFRPVDPQLFFFSLIGAVDRFFAARTILRYCFGEDSLTEELRDRYRAHAVDFILAGLLRK